MADPKPPDLKVPDPPPAAAAPDPGPPPGRAKKGAGDTATAQAALKHRPVEEIQEDLDDARATLVKATPEIEADAAKVRRQNERIATAKRKWPLSHEPDEPFNPGSFSPPLVPAKIDPARQKAFHALHYRIAFLERELANAAKAAVTELA
jgi:hypothetical protein